MLLLDKLGDSKLPLAPPNKVLLSDDDMALTRVSSCAHTCLTAFASGKM